jgi:hypothetical protein
MMMKQGLAKKIHPRLPGRSRMPMGVLVVRKKRIKRRTSDSL